MILCAGPSFHHEPQGEGVFVPGLAPGTIDGVRMISPKPTLASIPTLAYERSGSALSVGSSLPSPPTPKRLEMTPANRILPDNQLGLTQESSPTATTALDPPTPRTDQEEEEQTLEQTQQHQPAVPPNQPNQPNSPAPAGTGSGSPPAPPTNQAPATAPVNGPGGPAIATPAEGATAPPDKADVVIQGTMYTDGTYWKKHVCTRRISCCFVLFLINAYP